MQILIVDDEEFYLQIIKRYLDKKLDAKIVCTTSAERSLDLARKEKFDLIISDLHLPGMKDGEIVLKLNKINPKQIFFIASAFELPEKMFRDEKVNVAAYFEKPFDMDSMYNKMQQLFSKSQDINI